MQESTTVVTLTGRRPSFELCEAYVHAQENAWFHWLIVDDGDPPVVLQPSMLPTTIIRPDKLWNPKEPKNTLSSNLLLALEWCRRSMYAQKIIFMEDDDWYAPCYVSVMRAALDRSDIVGEGNARYYNLRTRQWQYMGNTSHASLAQTGIRRDSMIDTLIEVAKQRTSGGIDIELWARAKRDNQRCEMGRAKEYRRCELWMQDVPMAVSLKGLPGRPGIGIGHRPPYYWPEDKDGSVFRTWLGQDANRYYERGWIR